MENKEREDYLHLESPATPANRYKSPWFLAVKHFSESVTRVQPHIFDFEGTSAHYKKKMIDG